MKKSDFYRMYAKMIDLCEYTGIEPLKCCKVNNNILQKLPEFTNISNQYMFALAIIDKVPVFEGDTVYFMNNPIIFDKNYIPSLILDPKYWSITKKESKDITQRAIFSTAWGNVLIELTRNGKTREITAKVIRNENEDDN